MELNSADQVFKANPHPVYASLRAEQPVARVTLNGMPGWFVTSYDLVRELLTDDRLSSNATSAGGPRSSAWVNSRFAGQLNRLDPPDHTRVRALIAKAFVPRRVSLLRPRIQEVADTLLDAVPPGAEVDLIPAFVNQLPLVVIMEMLGMKPSERGEFEHWVELVMSTDPEVAHLVPEGWEHILRHLRELVASKSGNDPDTDVLSALVAARESGDRLNDDELVSAALVLLLAGHATTVDLIGNGVFALLTIPGLVAQARADMGAFVEEVLRHSVSVEMPMPRFALEDMMVGTVLVRQGEALFLSLPAANRDPARFAAPDRFDVSRNDSGHLAFGHGRHFCVGAYLARMEAEIAFSTLLDRFPALRLAADPGDIRWKIHPHLRGLVALPVICGVEVAAPDLVP